MDGQKGLSQTGERVRMPKESLATGQKREECGANKVGLGRVSHVDSGLG